MAGYDLRRMFFMVPRIKNPNCQKMLYFVRAASTTCLYLRIFNPPRGPRLVRDAVKDYECQIPTTSWGYARFTLCADRRF